MSTFLAFYDMFANRIIFLFIKYIEFLYELRSYFE